MRSYTGCGVSILDGGVEKEDMVLIYRMSC